MCINAAVESKDERGGCLKIWGQKQVELGMAECVIVLLDYFLFGNAINDWLTALGTHLHLTPLVEKLPGQSPALSELKRYSFIEGSYKLSYNG